MAIQKLFLNQAKIDSVEVSENQVIQETDRWINFAINQMGSKEKLEEYFGKKISQLKDERKEMIMEQQTVEQMKRQLIGEIKLTPSEVRKYYSQLSKDSLPNIPTTVEVQIITMEPKIPFEETDAIKARLRQFTERCRWPLPACPASTAVHRSARCSRSPGLPSTARDGGWARHAG